MVGCALRAYPPYEGKNGLCSAAVAGEGLAQRGGTLVVALAEDDDLAGVQYASVIGLFHPGIV